jgi:hypothetical protein
MVDELIRQNDPRALGNGDVFDSYCYKGFEAMKKIYGEQFDWDYAIGFVVAWIDSTLEVFTSCSKLL